ncbi:succinate dehydrogenase/fumarate reductase iron-sulfur subunit [bacterium]|nr:succinate dehydrogenase/fumarate reductase iron-sulfur subunit [bacterium]
MTTLKVRIWRGTESGDFQDFEVPREESQTVLDVVTYVQRHLDPSLAYRFACRVGMCGSCAMTVNGQSRWTCRTHVSKVAEDGRLEIAPLHNLPVIRDLVTDMSEFFDKWAKAHGQFTGTRTRYEDFESISPASAERQQVDAAIECIGCGVCYSACDVVSWNPDYAGPAALNRAWTLVNDVRDAATLERLRAVAGDAGAHACHTHMSCTDRCPKQISPTAGIAGLKRAIAKAALKGEL